MRCAFLYKLGLLTVWLGGCCLPRLGAQDNSAFYVLEGHLRSREDSSAVAYAHVFVSDRSRFSITDTLGFFSVSVELGDTLLFSSLQYELRGIIITEPPPREGVTIWLRPKVYELSEIRIYAENPLRGFFSHRRIDYARRSRRPFRPSRPSIGLGRGSQENPMPSVTIDGLLSSLLNPLTSEYRQMKKLHEIRREEQLERYYKNLLTDRLSAEFVQSHLPLLEEELSDFLAFWRPESLFLEMSSDYELVLAMQKAKPLYIEHLLRIHSYRGYKDGVSTIELRELLSSEPDMSTFAPTRNDE